MKRNAIGFIAAISIGMLASACGSNNTPEPPRFASPPAIGGTIAGGGLSGNSRANSTVYTKGDYRPSAEFANYCETPRVGVDPLTQKNYPDNQGSRAHEKHFLRSWTHETYLWYQELPDLDPTTNITTADYFSQLITSRKTDDGRPVDRFHFYQQQASADQFTFEGTIGGYGLHLLFSTEDTAQGSIQSAFVIFVDEGSPAHISGVSRGLELIGIDDINLPPHTEVDAHKANSALFNSVLGETHSFHFKTADGVVVHHTLKSSTVTAFAVNAQKTIQTTSGTVGYLSVNSFGSFLAEQELADAISEFSNSGIDDLIIDFRYNLGGLIRTSSELAYMTAGEIATDGKNYGVARYNDKFANFDEDIPFINQIEDNNGSNRELPSLNLNRVYVITTANTCSASEMYINSLRGIGVQVIQIGEQTCGKPYLFMPTPNCGLIYYSINAIVENDQGFAGYNEGFNPVATGDPLSNQVTGCSASDELSAELGDENEEMLAQALFHRLNGRCLPHQSGLFKVQNTLYSPHGLIHPDLSSSARLIP